MFLLRFLSTVFLQWLSGTKCLHGTTKARSRFCKGGKIYFLLHRINRFWFFNKILLSGEISLNRGPHFAGMFFPHINIPLVSLFSLKYMLNSFVSITWNRFLSYSLAISTILTNIKIIIANTKKYLQSDWLREVQYWPYLYSVFNICTLWLNKKKQKIQHSISVVEI